MISIPSLASAPAAVAIAVSPSLARAGAASGNVKPTPPAAIIPLIAVHGDSRVVGIYAKQAQDADYARVSQHVVGDYSYPLAAGSTR